MNNLVNFIYKLVDSPEYLILGLVFLAASTSIFGIYYITTQKNTVGGRISRFVPGAQKASSAKEAGLVDSGNGGVVQKISTPLYQAILPSKESERKEGRLRLIRAGYRSNAAYRNFLVLKFLCAIIFPSAFLYTVFFYKLSLSALMCGLALALAGFLLPSFVLKVITQHRQQEISRALPDALDLMVVCAESGLGLDMTFKRVGEEIRSLSKNLSDEYHLTIMEIRAGRPRTDCFHNMALRTGVQEVNNLMTILIQASRFGTSISTALRVHAEAMRIKRRQIAEEKAAKVAVKLVFPMLFFVFPAILIVIGGPAFIKIYKVLLPALSGGG